jgi:uncharacterized protein (DUF433 family)
MLEKSDNLRVLDRTTPMTDLRDRINIDPAVCGGKPCIKGTRMRVRDVLALLAAGAPREEILADYPYLKDEDISAALDYAARQLDHPVLAAE